MKQSRIDSGAVKRPFSQEDVDRWNNDLQVLEQVRQECELAMQAGFPVTEYTDACKALSDQITQLKKTYAPNQP